MSLIKINLAKLSSKKAQEAKDQRKAAYEQEADPLFFKWQAGESTQAKWQEKRNEIKQRFPKE
jgi:hypothetical protein